MKPHELGLTTFLAEPGRRRVRTLLEMGPKKRARLRALLCHHMSLDPRYAQRLATGALDALRSHGAPEICHVIASDPSLDGRDMPLDGALLALEAQGGGFLSCIPGKLGYFAFEDLGETYILRK
jgi:hypothetical protein